MAEFIGQGACPVCRSPKARYSVSSKQLAVVTCNACNFQGFARSDRSDEILRQNIAPATPPADPVPPAPAPGDPPAPAPEPEPPKPKRTIGWGVLAGREV